MAASDLRSWAVKGAEQRLGEIAEEAKLIFRTFPELRHRGRGFDLSKASATLPGKATNRRHRRKMSAAARKAVSDRMKKYWAARRGGAHKVTPSREAAQANGQPRNRQGGARKMSAAARKRISEAQKARWAKVKRRAVNR